MATVIAGKYKGRKFKTGKDPALRPTQGRVKKSMMQILEPFNELKVLDLFAGLGTLGIEAISRGAKSATFVEQKKVNFNYLKQNVKTICVNDNVTLENVDAFSFLSSTDDKFDIVLADPPYFNIDIINLLSLIPKVLLKNGKFAVEMKKMHIEEHNVRIKTYGNSQVVFG